MTQTTLITSANTSTKVPKLQELDIGSLFIGQHNYGSDDILFIVCEKSSTEHVAVALHDVNRSGLQFTDDDLKPNVYRPVKAVIYTVEY